MARNKNRLGSIASEIMSYGDTDLMQSRDAHNDMLNTAEKMALNDVRAQVRSYIGKVKFKRDAVVSHLSARETKRTEYAETKSDLVEHCGPYPSRPRLSYGCYLRRWIFISSPRQLRTLRALPTLLPATPSSG